MDDTDVISWLRIFFNRPDLNEKSLKPVLNFSLIWNLFEYVYFTDTTHLKPERLVDLANVSTPFLEKEMINDIFSYFKSRYLSRTELYNRLNLDQRESKGQTSNYEFCRQVFSSLNPSDLDKVKCLLLIIHRFRNNLFHGRKRPETLNTYETQFKNINNFLIHFIVKTAEKDSVNRNRLIK